MTDLVKQKVKFIIFGHHKVMLDALSNCLKQLKVKYIRIDGSTRNELRATYIEQFQKDNSCQVAVLSLQGMLTDCSNKTASMRNNIETILFIILTLSILLIFYSMQCGNHTDCSIVGCICGTRLEPEHIGTMRKSSSSYRSKVSCYVSLFIG